MNCNLSNNYYIPCKSIAGIKEIYIAQFKEGQINPSSSNNNGKVHYYTNSDGSIRQIDFIQRYFTFETNNETASFNQVATPSEENNTIFYTKTVELKLYGMQQSLANLTSILGKGIWSVIVLDQNGKYWIMDMLNRANVTTASIGLGKQYGDLNGVSITIETKGSNPMTQLEDGLFPTGMGCPICDVVTGSFSPTDPENPSAADYSQALFYFTPEYNSDGTEVTYDIEIYFTVSGVDYLLDSFTNINRGWDTSPYYNQPFPWPFYAQYSTLLNFNGFIDNSMYKYVITTHGTDGISNTIRKCDSRNFIYYSNCPITTYTFSGYGDTVAFQFFWTQLQGFDYDIIIYQAGTDTIIWSDQVVTNGYQTPFSFEENHYYDYIIYPSNPSNPNCGRQELVAEI